MENWVLEADPLEVDPVLEVVDLVAEVDPVAVAVDLVVEVDPVAVAVDLVVEAADPVVEVADPVVEVALAAADLRVVDLAVVDLRAALSELGVAHPVAAEVAVAVAAKVVPVKRSARETEGFLQRAKLPSEH